MFLSLHELFLLFADAVQSTLGNLSPGLKLLDQTECAPGAKFLLLPFIKGKEGFAFEKRTESVEIISWRHYKRLKKDLKSQRMHGSIAISKRVGKYRSFAECSKLLNSIASANIF